MVSGLSIIFMVLPYFLLVIFIVMLIMWRSIDTQLKILLN